MRVTSASASASSLATSAASQALCEPVRSEPGMTRIFGAAMFGTFSQPAAAGPSGLAVYPDARRRNIHPDPFGRFGREAAEPLRQRRGDRIGELHEWRAR